MLLLPPAASSFPLLPHFPHFLCAFALNFFLDLKFLDRSVYLVYVWLLWRVQLIIQTIVLIGLRQKHEHHRLFYHVTWEQTPSGVHKRIWLTVVAGPLQQHGMIKLLSKHDRYRTPGNPLSRQWCLKKECCTVLWLHKSYVGVRWSIVEYSLRKLGGGSVCVDVFTPAQHSYFYLFFLSLDRKSYVLNCYMTYSNHGHLKYTILFH